MALQIGDNFDYQGKKPNFERDQFLTLAEMKAYPETSVDEGHISFCVEDGKRYEFNEANPVDPTTGKWREYNSTKYPPKDGSLYGVKDEEYALIIGSEIPIGAGLKDVIISPLDGTPQYQNFNRVIADLSWQFKKGDRLKSVSLPMASEISKDSELRIYTKEKVLKKTYPLGRLSPNENVIDVSGKNIILSDGDIVGFGFISYSYGGTGKYYDLLNKEEVNGFNYFFGVTYATFEISNKTISDVVIGTDVKVETLEKEVTEIKSEVEKQGLDLYGSADSFPSSQWKDGYFETNRPGVVIANEPTSLPPYKNIEIPCKEGDTFELKVNNGENARGWNFLRSNRTVISQAEGFYGPMQATIQAPKEATTLLLNTRGFDNGVYAKKVKDAIWKKYFDENCHPNIPIDPSKPLQGLTIAYIGDSAIDVGNREWPQWCSDMLGAKAKIYATGGFTYTNQFTEAGDYKTCMKLLVDRLINDSKSQGWTPDIIVCQIGGNDIWLVTGHDEVLGNINVAFSDRNYQTLAKDKTFYGGIRYNLERLLDTFQDASLIVGTVFQHRDNDASIVCKPIKEVCEKLAIPVIDGNKYSGISAKTELVSPHIYSDNPDGRNVGTREYPQYNWVEPNGTVVSKDSKTESAIKKYGRYTYDGTHKTLKGENHVAKFMASQICNYIQFNKIGQNEKVF